MNRRQFFGTLTAGLAWIGLGPKIEAKSGWCVSRSIDGGHEWWTGARWSPDLADAKFYATKVESDAVRDRLRG